MISHNLSMSRRIRQTPFTNKAEEHGVSGFTIVNRMLLPKAFKKSIEEDYWHLNSNVQIWDVSCQRQVQITGPDSEKLVQLMTPRSIKNMNIGKCFYIPLIDENAGMINDPVLLKIKNDNYITSKFKIILKKNIDDKKKEEFNIWLDDKSKIILKVSYSKFGNWEYIVTNVEKTY